MNSIQTIFTEGGIYVLIYVIIFVFTILESSKQYARISKLTSWFTMLLMILFIGLRWETGTDWESYKELYDTLELDWTFLINIYHFDVGYVIFNALIKMLTDNYTIFLIINAFITIYILWRLVVKTSPYPNLSLFLFYTAFMIIQFMGSNRRMMAMVFVLWAFYYLFKKNKLAFYLMIALAFLFHRSAIVCLIALIIPRKMFSIKQTVWLLFGGLAFGIIQLPAKIIELTGSILSTIMNNPFVEKMLFYSESGEDHIASSTGNIVISTILAVAKRSIFLMFYIYVMRKNNIDKLTQYIYNIYIFGFVGYLMFVGSFFQMVTAFFALIEIILLSRFYNYTTGKVKLVVLMIIFVYGLIQLISALNVYPELYIPYINCFSTETRVTL